jgi:hypothetical protein
MYDVTPFISDDIESLEPVRVTVEVIGVSCRPLPHHHIIRFNHITNVNTIDTTTIWKTFVMKISTFKYYNPFKIGLVYTTAPDVINDL